MGKKLAKKLGRPPVMGESKMFTIRVPVEDIKRWKQAVGAHGNISEWVRMACNKQAIKDEKQKEKG
jgi:hypothetical protein